MFIPETISQKRIQAFCQRWKITRMEVFGSALTKDFSDASDIDLLVEFDPSFHRTLSDQIMMQEELEELFGREVDFIVKKTIQNSRNPYKRSNILNNTREIYVEG
jgi:predicted nucleotidyltransferase